MIIQWIAVVGKCLDLLESSSGCGPEGHRIATSHASEEMQYGGEYDSASGDRNGMVYDSWAAGVYGYGMAATVPALQFEELQFEESPVQTNPMRYGRRAACW